MVQFSDVSVVKPFSFLFFYLEVLVFNALQHLPDDSREARWRYGRLSSLIMLLALLERRDPSIQREQGNSNYFLGCVYDPGELFCLLLLLNSSCTVL